MTGTNSEIHKVEIYSNDVVVNRKRISNSSNQYADCTRGEVTEFSWASRKRLAFVASNCEVKFKKMITLTYGKNVPQSGKTSKKHLRTFMKRLRRVHGSFDYLWFMEFQKRGAVHFHILLDISEYVCYKKVASDWTEITSGDSDHLKAGTRVDKLRKQDGRYAVKYALKMEQKEVPDNFSDVGRLWGHSYNVKPRVKETVYLNDDMLVVALGMTRRALEQVVGGYRVLFGDSENIIRNLELDKGGTLD